MVKNLFNLFFPDLCLSCQDKLSDNEIDFCSGCRHEFPLTKFHFYRDNSINKIFKGRVALAEATALFRFKKSGLVQQLLHNLKYRGHERISAVLGRWLGPELRSCNQFSSVDAVIPVPLHRKKLKQRGYNQVSGFGREIAKALEIDYLEDVLIKYEATATQVFKKRFARWQHKETEFRLINPSKIAGRHLLLVDDLITTGATVEACSNVLLSGEPDKISVASMAIAD